MIKEKLIQLLKPRHKTPPGCLFIIGQGGPSCHSPDIIRKSLFKPLLESGRHWMSLTSGYVDLR